MRGLLLPALLLCAIAVFGCCGPITGGAPYVNIELNQTEGPAPFWPQYSYWCQEGSTALQWCELKIVGQTYARGSDQDTLMPDDYVHPQFYTDAISTPGTHMIEIIGTDNDGQTSEANITFTVLPGEDITDPGWYDCNTDPRQPCDAFKSVYCSRIAPTDLVVREAAALAIDKHPGAYSVNQILDVYDWVYGNVIYQNVPVNLTYQPYAPSETLATKSGDCKNHAVLIASMIEAIGGTARVLLIPGCSHAFAEVYLGDQNDTDRVIEAIYAHYSSRAPSVNWHYSTLANNTTEIWMPFDTAGGQYPGNTIDACFNASQTFVMYNCMQEKMDKVAPDVSRIEYGPFDLYDKNLVIDAHTWTYFTYSVDKSQYDFCYYDVKLHSKARLFDWFIIPADQYDNFKAGRSYGLYYEEEQVADANYTFGMQKPDEFRIIVKNGNDNAMTVVPSISDRCYKN